MTLWAVVIIEGENRHSLLHSCLKEEYVQPMDFQCSSRQFHVKLISPTCSILSSRISLPLWNFLLNTSVKLELNMQWPSLWCHNLPKFYYSHDFFFEKMKIKIREKGNSPPTHHDSECYSLNAKIIWRPCDFCDNYLKILFYTFPLPPNFDEILELFYHSLSGCHNFTICRRYFWEINNNYIYNWTIVDWNNDYQPQFKRII